MRGSTLVTALVACVLLTACGPVPEENAGGVATPSAWHSESATPYATPSETVPAVRPSTPAPRERTPVHRPAPRRAAPHRTVRHAPKADHPAGATAECRDGTFSHAAHHQGACSHHGGVLKFFR
jgi:hypothetical protein